MVGRFPLSHFKIAATRSATSRSISSNMANRRRSTARLRVGTSSIVYPAAALPGLALQAGSFVVEVNPEPTDLACNLHWRTTAAVGLPQLVDQLTADTGRSA